ncbi:MAG TPA: septum formation initiator family protein, partial [Acidimicrobiales bacterium]|nr:septum formation initiator family protein [Acidimicrobiales bacterium]
RRRERGPQRVLRGLRALDLDRLLPTDPEARAEKVARWQRRGLLVAAVVVACVLIYTVFPVRTALELRAAEDRARERQAAFERENPILEDEVADLRTDDRIEEEARELGLVYPGEESYGIYPAPEDTAPAPTTTTSTTRPGG